MKRDRKTVTSACPRNCYSTCGLTLHVEAGRLRAVEALPENLATGGGPCLKGLAYVERVHSPERITHPLRRRGKDFEPVGWDTALDEIANKLRQLRTESGPQSVLYYSASGTKGLLNGCGLEFWRLFGGCTTTYGDLCWPAGLEATRLTLGANSHNAPWDLVNARLIVLWGKNPAETNIHQMDFIATARERGAKLVVIDPRRTESAERADLLLQPRPGTDGALALALANLLIAADAVDAEFITAHVQGYQAFAARAAEWPLERAAAHCDLPAGNISALAEIFATVKPATLCAGFGMQRYAGSGQAIRTLIALPVITGNIGLPGAGWQFANLQTQIFGERDPVAFFPPVNGDADPVRVSVSTARLGRDMAAQQDPALRMVWVERGNPASQNPETAAVLAAFRGLDFRVVVEQFMTDTAREADIILPAKSFVEQADVIGAYWHPYLQYRAKLLPPPGAVRPETEIYRALAARLDLPTAAVDAAIPGPGDDAIEAWLERRLAPFPGLDLAALKRGPVLSPEFEPVAFADRRFPTPSGRIELESEEAAARWGVDALPDQVDGPESGASSALAARYPLLFMTPNTKNRIHSQFGNLALIRALDPAPRLHLHPEDAVTRDIRTGDRLRLFNERGELELVARIDPDLKPGCVLSHNGWWRSEGGGVNLCSRGLETDLGHGAAFHENRVQVEKVRP